MKKKSNILVIVIIILIVIITGYMIYDNIYLNSYNYAKSLLKTEASKYIENNGTDTTLNYLDNYTLKVKIKDTCSGISGVFIENDNIYPYLKCDNYESSIYDNESSYTLNGDSIMFIPVGYNYVDLGVNNLNVKPTGILNTNIIGVYKLSYTVPDGELTRIIVVTNNAEITNLYPKITLKGDSIDTVIRLNDYTDLGVYAFDNVDGNISTKVIVSGKVNTTITGDYTLTYTITNSRGYSNSVTRKVSVVDEEEMTITNTDLITTTTNSSIAVDFIITGDNYSYSVLPDGKITYDRVFTYYFDKNGNYTLTSYGTDDKSVNKNFVINNIDKSIPTGTCTLYRYYTYNKFVVNVNSNSNVNGYKYIYNNTQSDYSSKNTYITNNTSYKKGSVLIKNNIGTENSISCTLVDYYNDPTKLQDAGTPRKVYTNSKDKQVLSGFIGLFQSNYGGIPFKSTGKLGNVAKNGCSITSFTQIISGFVRKEDGSYYDVTDTIQVYNSVCSSSCSGSSAATKAAHKYGLSVSKSYNNFKSNKETAIKLLKKGGCLFLRVGCCTYTTGGHLMAVLAISDDGKQVFLADTSGGLTTSAGGKKNQWVDIDYLADRVGSGSWFMAIGPKGVYE